MKSGAVPARIEFSHYLGSINWFVTQPREASVTIAARLALRMLPTVVRFSAGSTLRYSTELSVFRANMVAWVAAKYPTHRKTLRAAAIAAARAADAIDAATTADAAAISSAAARAAAAPQGPIGGGRDAAGQAAEATTACHDQILINAAAADAATIAQEPNRPERVKLAVKLADASLWPKRGVPRSIVEDWEELKTILRGDGDHWEVWIDWYEDRLAGRPSLGEAFDIAVATLPNAFWQQGPKAVNARIKELIAEHTPPEPIPAQGAGPHFSLDADIQIALVASPEIDATGNNVPRINEVLPLARRATDRLVAALGSTNAFTALAEDARDYRQSIEGEPETIAWGTVFGLGVMLESVATAAERPLPDRMRPSLEDDAKAALESVLTLHAAMILETGAGRDLMAQADRVRLTPAQQTALREYAQEIANALRADERLIKPDAASITAKASGSIGGEPHAEQGTAFGLATVGHLATILVPAAVVGEFAFEAGGIVQAALPLAGSLVLRESQKVRAAAQALAGEYDRLVDTVVDQAGLMRAQAIERLRLLAPFKEFVLKHQHPLLQIAENSTNLH